MKNFQYLLEMAGKNKYGKWIGVFFGVLLCFIGGLVTALFNNPLGAFIIIGGVILAFASVIYT